MPTFRKSGLTQAQYEGLTTHIDKLYTDCPPEMLNGKKTATKTASQEILSEEDSEVSETDSDNDIDNIDLTKLKTFFSAISSKTTIYTHLKECLDLEAPAFAFFLQRNRRF